MTTTNRILFRAAAALLAAAAIAPAAAAQSLDRTVMPAPGPTPEVDFPAELKRGNVAVAVFIGALFLAIAMIIGFGFAEALTIYAFVTMFLQHRETYGKARLLLADEVGLGKTLKGASFSLYSAVPAMARMAMDAGSCPSSAA